MEAAASDGERDSARRLPSSASSASFARADASRSVLSIDDLSLDRGESTSRGDETALNNGDKGAVAADGGASGMESKLQCNLRAQQAHYARQRRLFEDLRADTAVVLPTPSACCSSSFSSPSSRSSSPCTEEPAGHRLTEASGSKSTQFKLELPRNEGDKWRKSAHDEEEKHESAHAAVRRVKDRALADYKRRIACYHQHKRTKPAKATHQHNQAFVEELEQQEASNDALRRQLELLRRLQVDNNRFRVENRTLRERNDALSETLDVRDREIQLLREEVADKSARINRDQASLAGAAQTAKKLKAAHKQLAAAHSDMDKLREALDGALKAHEEADAKAQEQLLDVGSEVKRLKKANRQLKQRERALHEDADAYRSSIEELEQTASELKARAQDLKRERNKLAAQLADKSAQYESFETSTTECVHKLQAEVVGLQGALTDECNKLEKAESEREAQETQLEQLERLAREKDAKLRELEHEHSSAQLKFQERRRAYREHVAALEEKLELSISNQRVDAETIGNLRRQCESVALQASESDERAVETARKTRGEVRALRRALDSMRKYVEQAAAATVEGEEHAAATDDTQTLLASPRQRLDLGVPDEAEHDDETDGDSASPQSELQVARAAASALRHAVMDAVHELQQSRHVARQHVHKVASQRARVQDMERRLREDAAALERERERRRIAEQAREIALKEKAEVLQWSEQACHKAEALEHKLNKSEAAVGKLIRKLAKGLRSHDSLDDESVSDEAGDLLAGLLLRVDKRFDELLAVSEDLKRVREQQSREIHDLEENQRRLESEMGDKALEAKQMLAEVEALHARNVEEVKRRLREQIADAESEKQGLSDKLVAANEKTTTLLNSVKQLKEQLTALESDVPVLAAVAHLFAATTRPLIQQVSDLIAQKRLLRRENAEYALHLDQIKCVGQVLKEMLPPSSLLPAADASARRGTRCRQVFRRVVIAVFAANRLRQFSTPLNRSRDADSRPGRTVYGVNTALLTSSSTRGARSRTWSRSLEAPCLVIKVLPLKETVAKLPLRVLLERLRALHIAEMLASAMESDGDDDGLSRTSKSTPNVGGLVLQVLSAMDAGASDLLVQNVSGTFHCRALLERRRRQTSRQVSDRNAASNSWRRRQEHDDDDDARPSGRDEDTLPAVELIQRRIIALGKRVEDLHFQRNSLQQENYEFQFQLEQQAAALNEMQRLASNTEELQTELAELRQLSAEQYAGLQAACDQKDALVLDKTRELEDAAERIVQSERELQQSEGKRAAVAAEKAALERQVERLKQQQADEEATADKTRADARRQQQEARQLKQTVKRAHELYQKVQAQLERETMDRAALEASFDHLRLKCDRLERELHEEKRREVERSFDDGEIELSSKKSGACAMSDRSSRRPQCSPRSPMAVSFEDLAVRRPTVDDSDEEEEEEDASSVAAKVSDTRQARHASSNEQFMREWRRLDVSTAFLDAPACMKGDKDGGERRDAEATAASPPPAWLANTTSTTKSSPTRAKSSIRKPSTRAELARAADDGGRSRRAVEVDKVNAAVHDYMDRIDDKLSKMYGIPKSAVMARGRGPGNSSPMAANDVNSDVNSDDDVDVSGAEDTISQSGRRHVYG